MNSAVKYETELYLRQLVRKSVRAQIKKLICEGKVPGLSQDDVNLNAGKRRQRFITISLKPEQWSDKFCFEFIAWVKARPWLEGSKFCFEQRGGPDDDGFPLGRGLHIHLVTPTKKIPCEIKRELAKRFKLEPQFVDVRPVVDLDGVMAYMSGQKNDIAKNAKIPYDAIMRRKWGLEDLYSI